MADDHEVPKVNPSKGILRDNTVPILGSRRRVSFAPEVTLHKFQNVEYPSSKRRRTIGFQYSDSGSATESTSSFSGYDIVGSSGSTEDVASGGEVEKQHNSDLANTRELLVDSSDLSEDSNNEESNRPQINEVEKNDDDEEVPMELTDQIKFVPQQGQENDLQRDENHDDEEQTMEFTGQIEYEIMQQILKSSILNSRYTGDKQEEEEEEEDDVEQTMEFTGQISTANIIIPRPQLDEIGEEPEKTGDEDSQLKINIPNQGSPDKDKDKVVTTKEIQGNENNNVRDQIQIDEDRQNNSKVKDRENDDEMQAEEGEKLDSSLRIEHRDLTTEKENPQDADEEVDMEQTDVISMVNQQRMFGAIDDDGQVTMEFTQSISKTTQFSVSDSTSDRELLQTSRDDQQDLIKEHSLQNPIEGGIDEPKQGDDVEVTMDFTLQKPFQSDMVGSNNVEPKVEEMYGESQNEMTNDNDNQESEVRKISSENAEIPDNESKNTNTEDVNEATNLADERERVNDSPIGSEQAPELEPYGSQPMELTQEDRVDTIETFADEVSLNSIKEVVSTSTVPLADISRDLEDDHYSPVTLKEFMEDIHVNFYDDLDMGSDYRTSFSNITKEYTIEDYSIALPKLELLGLYEFSCEELKKNIEEGRKVFAEYNNTIEINNPPLFREYYSSDENTKLNMNLKLQQLKDYARLQSKKIWYDWRTQLTENLLHELSIRLQNMQNDKESLTTDIVKVDELRKISKERLESLRLRMDHARQLKQKLSELDKDEFLRIKESLLKTGSELLSIKNELEMKNKQFLELSAKIRQISSDQEHLQRGISECKKTLSRYRNYDRDEIVLLTLKFKFLQQYSKLDFVSMNDKIMDFEYDKTFNVSFDFRDISNPHNLMVSTIPNESKKAENGRGFVIKNKFLEELTVSILKNVQASNMIDKFQAFAKIWKQAKQFDRDIFKIGLICPVSSDLKGSTLTISFSYCNFVKDYKLHISCVLELEQLLDYLNKIAIDLELLRGSSISKSMIENDLKNDVPKTGILSERNIKQLQLNLNVHNGVK